MTTGGGCRAWLSVMGMGLLIGEGLDLDRMRASKEDSSARGR